MASHTKSSDGRITQSQHRGSKSLILLFLVVSSVFAAFLIVQGNLHITDLSQHSSIRRKRHDTKKNNIQTIETKPKVEGYQGYIKGKAHRKATELAQVPEFPTLEEKIEDIKQHNYRQLQNPNGQHRLHIVFSSGCSEFQQWQSLVLLHSAQKLVPQPSRITRIVSGCTDSSVGDELPAARGGPSKVKKTTPREVIEQTTNPRAHFHYTPTFEGASAFPWMNKPFGLSHWLETRGDSIDEEVIAILDPDFVFLGPAFSQEPAHLARSWEGELICTQGGCPEGPFSDEVWPGHPVAQRYGLNTRMADPGVFDRDRICGKESSCATAGRRQSMNHFSIGPPYIMSTPDARRLLPLWKDLMPPVYENDKNDIIADMWAFSMAAAHLRLPFLTLDHYMVSTPGKEGYNKGEAWAWINELEHLSCRNPVPPQNLLDGSPHRFKLPTFIHMAQTYKAGAWQFHKKRVPPAIFSCAAPLLRVPPDNLFDVQTGVRPRHNAFMLCSLIFHINDAVLAWKRQFCQEPFEKRELYRLSPHRVTVCPRKSPPPFGVSPEVPCWEYATLEEEDSE